MQVARAADRWSAEDHSWLARCRSPGGLRTYVSVDAAKFVAQSLDAQLQVDAAFAVKTDRTFCQFGARCLLTWSETPTDVRTAKSELAFAWSSSRAAIC